MYYLDAYFILKYVNPINYHWLLLDPGLFISIIHGLEAPRDLARIFITGCPKWGFKKTGCPNPLAEKK